MARRAPLRVPPLFGGPRSAAARRPVVFDGGVGMGDLLTDSSSLPYGAPSNWGSASVEAWRDLVTAQAGDKPVDFLMAWIAVESGGNACDYTSLKEAGIFQLMAGDNESVAGTTEALIHPVPPCTAGTRTIVPFSALSSDQKNEQVRSGLAYVDYCRAYAHTQLDANGYTWPESSGDFWICVKMVHVAPAALKSILAQGVAGNGGTAPADWSSLTQFVSGVPASWLSNAESVGQFGAGGGSLLSSLAAPSNLLILAAIAAGAYFIWTEVK